MRSFTGRLGTKPAGLNELIKAGDKRLFLVEGEDLIGFKEHQALSKDGIHPSDQRLQHHRGKALARAQEGDWLMKRTFGFLVNQLL